MLWRGTSEITLPALASPSVPAPALAPSLTAHRGSRLQGCSRCPAAGSCHPCPPPAAASPQPLGWWPRGRRAPCPCQGRVPAAAALPVLPPTVPQPCAALSLPVLLADVNRMCSHLWSLCTGWDSTEGRARNEHRILVGFFFLSVFLLRRLQHPRTITPVLQRCHFTAMWLLLSRDGTDALAGTGRAGPGHCCQRLCQALLSSGVNPRRLLSQAGIVF